MDELQALLQIAKPGGIATLLIVALWLVRQHYKMLLSKEEGRTSEQKGEKNGYIRLTLKTLQLAHPEAYKQALEELAQERAATGGSS